MTFPTEHFQTPLRLTSPSANIYFVTNFSSVYGARLCATKRTHHYELAQQLRQIDVLSQRYSTFVRSVLSKVYCISTRIAQPKMTTLHHYPDRWLRDAYQANTFMIISTFRNQDSNVFCGSCGCRNRNSSARICAGGIFFINTRRSCSAGMTECRSIRIK